MIFTSMNNSDFKVRIIANDRIKCKDEPDVLHLWVFYYIQSATEKLYMRERFYWYFFNFALSMLGLFYNNNWLKLNYKLAFLDAISFWYSVNGGQCETEWVARRTVQRKMLLCAFYLHWSRFRPGDLMMRASGPFPLGEKINTGWNQSCLQMTEQHEHWEDSKRARLCFIWSSTPLHEFNSQPAKETRFSAGLSSKCGL